MFAVSLWNDWSTPARAEAPVAIAAPLASPEAPADTPVDVPQPTPAPLVEAPVMLPLAPATPVANTWISTALVITSDPSGARVVVDGIGRGTTPLTVQHLAGGVRRVRVIKDGFTSQERDIRVGSSREPATLHVTLNAVP
jgi:PEGA domain